MTYLPIFKIKLKTIDMTRQELEKWVDTLPVQKVKTLLAECVDELMLTESINALDDEPYWDASGDRLSDIRVPDSIVQESSRINQIGSDRDVIDMLTEMKFGRPAKVQITIDRWIHEITEYVHIEYVYSVVKINESFGYFTEKDAAERYISIQKDPHLYSIEKHKILS